MGNTFIVFLHPALRRGTSGAVNDRKHGRHIHISSRLIFYIIKRCGVFSIGVYHLVLEDKQNKRQEPVLFQGLLRNPGILTHLELSQVWH